MGESSARATEASPDTAVWPKEVPRQNPRKQTMGICVKVHLPHLMHLRLNRR
jgi:hypothetical protein